MVEDNFRTLLVANPTSAGGALGRRWHRLSRTIEAEFGPFDVQFTEGPGDGARIARGGAGEGYEMVVAVGGDGTISEVVDGLFTEDGAVAPEVVLGVLPFGTGGDFRKTIGAPKELCPGARALRGRTCRAIDVGRLTYTDEQGERRVRHFVNIASFGVSGQVDRFVNQGSKLLGGRVSFLLATARATLSYRAQKVELRLDGGEPFAAPLHVGAVANGRYFGGGMRFAPDAELDDGLFDVVLMGPKTLADLLLRGHHVYKGSHVTMPDVTVARARRVEARPLDPAEAVLLDVDGETPGRLPATFELLPRALRLKDPGEAG